MLEVSHLDFDDVSDRVHRKYEVSLADAQLAAEYLRCFLDAKRFGSNDLIVLPQIADWAWHELILDTRRYKVICHSVLGQFLDHIVKPLPPDQGAFRDSLNFMRDTYGLPLGERPEEWLESGWDRPQYRLRHTVEIPSPSISGRELKMGPTDLDGVEFLSWLPSRIARRFGVPVAAALHAVREYSNFFLAQRTARNQHRLDSGSLPCQIAWEEHILWTQRYEADCRRLLGFFLDHVPRPLSKALSSPLHGYV